MNFFLLFLKTVLTFENWKDIQGVSRFFMVEWELRSRIGEEDWELEGKLRSGINR